jgi:putative ABC transport system ATP-binding protein
MPKKEDLMITTQALTKTYQVGDTKITVLKDINLTIENAKFIAICGPSGSGKTTLLNIISGIDRPTSGRIIVAKEDLTNQTEDFLSDFRCSKIGFVFQAYNLVSTLTVAENVAFPMEWVRKPEKEIEERVNMLLETVGLEHRANHFPSQLSGGEQQRVALARALSNDPPLILADEPTGNLDQKNGQKIIQILKTLKTNGKTVIVSTHDPEIRRLADKALCFEEGRLAESE